MTQYLETLCSNARSIGCWNNVDPMYQDKIDSLPENNEWQLMTTIEQQSMA